VTAQPHQPRPSLIAIAVTALLVIIVRFIFLTSLQPPILVRLINTAQTINLGLSLLTNVIATAVIIIKTW
jgi:uncharacterized membrane protein (DUF485 family)